MSSNRNLYPDLIFAHLSDFHFENPWSGHHKLVFERLLDDLHHLASAKHLAPDFIVLSGDIASRGKEPEYEVAARQLDRILEATGVSKEHLIISPGNHDVDRARISRVFHPQLKDQDDVTQLMRSSSDIGFLCQRFAGFKRFLDEYLSPANHGFTYEHPFYTRTLDIRGLRIGLAAMNSALLSQYEVEYGNLILGEYQIQTAIEELAASRHDLSIAIFHHPLSYFTTFDSDAITPLLMRNFDLVLTGHIHSAECYRFENPDGSIQIFGAGSEFGGQDWRNTFSIIRINAVHRKGSVFFRRWTKEGGGGRWAAYLGRYELQGDSDSIDFYLPDRTGISKHLTVPYSVASNQRLLQKLRPLLVLENENFSKDDGYVPLRYSFSLDSREPRHDLQNYLDGWLGDQNESTVFLFGEYGTGKSRFLRHYTGVLAHRFVQFPENSRIPLLVLLNNRRLHQTLDQFILSSLIHHYGINISWEELKQLMEQGKILLLIDGFDELAHNTEPEAIFKSLKELYFINYLNSKIIIAGRSGFLTPGRSLRRILSSGPSDDDDYLRYVISSTTVTEGEPDIQNLYLGMFDPEQMESFIRNYPNATAERKRQVREIIKDNRSIMNLAKRPVILQLLLDCESEVLSGSGMKRVTDLYSLVTETWLSRELASYGIQTAERDEAESAEIVAQSLEAFASHLFYKGNSAVKRSELRQLLLSFSWTPRASIPVDAVLDILESCIFLEPSAADSLSFRHRSFTEFHVARHILRTLKKGEIPNLGENLPSIEILDFLRELIDSEVARQCILMLDNLSPPSNVKIAFIIALRQFPAGMNDRLKRYVSDPTEPFGVRRVAAFSLAETDYRMVHELVSELVTNRRLQCENLKFLADLWKADDSEIVRRTRFRLEHLEDEKRPYWEAGRSVHIATLAYIGGQNELPLLLKFENDRDPFVSSCAQKAIDLINSRYSPQSRQLDQRLEVAFDVIRQAGKVLLKRFSGDNPILRLTPHDITTQADLDAQAIIIEGIQGSFPHDSILAEEQVDSIQSQNHETGYHWIIDPLDGSVNYASGLERFCISIAIENNGETVATVIYSPISGDIYWARQGRGAFFRDRMITVKAPPTDLKPLVVYSTSRHDEQYMSVVGGQLLREITTSFRSMRLLGSTSLDFCDLAAGRFDALVKLPGSKWDYFPGSLLVREAGGKVQFLRYPSDDRSLQYVVASCCDEISEQVKEVLRKVVGEREVLDS